MLEPFIILGGIIFIVLIAVSAFTHHVRSMVDEMHGMMIGMSVGMLSGLTTATLYTIPTGDFLGGVISGSIVGLLFGIPLGFLGGHLGLLEGIMAGPMGGMMGAMLGQMIRPFNLEIFIPFFSSIILISLIGVTYAVHCGVSCCKKEKTSQNHSAKSLIAPWTFGVIILMLASILLPFSINAKEQQSNSDNSVTLPSYLQQLTKETVQSTIQNGNSQEIEVQITSSAYIPNVIQAKQGIPLKITFNADETAGCGREVVIPDFSVRKIIPDKSSEVIEILPKEKGTFPFRCSMDMMRGKIVVE